MFKKLPFFLMIVLLISAPMIFLLNWQNGSNTQLFSASEVETVYRLHLDLSGKWNKYNSLRKAWSEENNPRYEQNRSIITSGSSMIIPSTESFQVAAKQFSVNNSWGSKILILTVEGLRGKANVYLNGIDNVNYIGSVDGYEGLNQLEITSTRLHYDQPNILFVETSESKISRRSIFSWLWTKKGRIIGDISLEGVPETSLNLVQTTTAYDPVQEQLVVHTGLWHHQSLKNGPWAVKGILRANGSKVAECLLPVYAEDNYMQEIKLLFDLPEPRFWSLKNPFLYDLEISVTNNRGDQDCLQFPIGIKMQQVDGAGKWLLNGEPLEIKGTAVSLALEAKTRGLKEIEQWMKEQKNEGYNLLYFTEHMPDESWLYTADQLGMGVWLETPLPLLTAGDLPDSEFFTRLFKISGRHPSVLSWTVLKDLYQDPAKEPYVKKIKEMVAPQPAYLLTYDQTSLLKQSQLQGAWGEVSPSEDNRSSESWQAETEASLIWLLVVIFAGIQNMRVVNIDYKQIFLQHPKRAIRRAFFWQSFNMVMRYATLAGITTALIYRFSPGAKGFWFQGSWEFTRDLQAQEPLLLWFLITAMLLFIRLLQVGVAAPFFPNRPQAFSLMVWLEKRNGWYLLNAAAWTMAIYGIPLYSAILIYLIFTVVLFPWRLKDIKKQQARYRHLMIVPAIISIFILACSAVHYGDFLYLWDYISSINFFRML